MKKLLFVVFLLASTSFAGGGRIAGSENGLVVIQEFADLECKYCIRGFHTMEEVLKNYPGKIKLVFRNLPLPAHLHALVAAKALTAVYLQSPTLSYSFQKEIFENQERLKKEGEPFLYEVAEKLGVNVQRMKTEMNGDAVAVIIAEDQKLADTLGFKATPSFLIGTEKVEGALPYDEIKKVVERQLGL